MHKTSKKFEQCCKFSYLNGINSHINLYLVLADILQRCHGVSDIIQVFDWSAEFLVDVVNEVKDTLHLGVVLVVTCLAVVQTPRSCFHIQGILQFFCGKGKSVFAWLGYGRIHSVYIDDFDEWHPKIAVIILNEHFTRKPVFGVCDQVRLKPACSATETS